MEFKIKRYKPNYTDTHYMRYRRNHPNRTKYTFVLCELGSRNRLFTLRQVRLYNYELLEVNRWNARHDEEYHPKAKRFTKHELNKIIFKELFTIKL